MKKRFTVDASKKAKGSQKIEAAYHGRWISAAKDAEVEDPRIEEAEVLHDRVEDDFDYVMQGIERLGREGLLEDAINLLHTLADTLDSAINIIGNDFDKKEDI